MIGMRGCLQAQQRHYRMRPAEPARVVGLEYRVEDGTQHTVAALRLQLCAAAGRSPHADDEDEDVPSPLEGREFEVTSAFFMLVASSMVMNNNHGYISDSRIWASGHGVCIFTTLGLQKLSIWAQHSRYIDVSEEVRLRHSARDPCIV